MTARVKLTATPSRARRAPVPYPLSAEAARGEGKGFVESATARHRRGTMPNVRAIVFHQHGVPHEVARLEDVEISSPGPDEVRVRVLAAPINPADLNVIAGKYPVLPPLPGVPGVEG